MCAYPTNKIQTCYPKHLFFLFGLTVYQIFLKKMDIYSFSYPPSVY